MINDFLINDINLDGFQMVQGGLFRKQQAPLMTLWKNAVQFNPTAYTMLNRCEAVHLLVDIKARQIVVRPCPSSDADAILWNRNPEEPKTTRIECASFTKQLFNSWNMESAFHYRSAGILVRYEDRMMLLFDFRRAEIWNGIKRVKGA